MIKSWGYALTDGISNLINRLEEVSSALLVLPQWKDTAFLSFCPFCNVRTPT
jgi:hypothetical protein